MRDNKILVTAIGSFSGDIVIKSLKKNNNIIACDIYEKSWIANADLVDKFYQVSKSVQDPNSYVTELIDICKLEKVKYLVPLTDPEIDILINYVDNFKEIGCELLLPEKNTVINCRDKRRYPKLVEEIEHLESIPSLKDINSFPVIGKKYNGRSSEGVIIIENKEIYSYYKKNPDYIFQPLLQGDIITVDVVRDKKGNIFSLARKELLRSANGAGLTVEIIQDSFIEKIITDLVIKLNVLGCINIELIKVKDQYYLMDINPRFSAGISFSLLAGYNFVENHMKCFLGKEIDKGKAIQKNIFTRKYVELCVK
ncbi:MAG: ATP-grasp domain-containing protein [Bacteroidales bacterium]|nr:ATP-grasp domain-containing protein [Bacteroidales bacterium]